MKKLIAILLMLSLVFGSAVTVFAANKPTKVDTVTSMTLEDFDGTVTITNGSGSKVTPEKGRSLYQKYTIKTGTNSYAYIALDKTKAIKLQSSSKLILKSANKGKKIDIMLEYGTIFTDTSEKLPSTAGYNLHTTSNVTGIRGTGDELSYDPVTGTTRNNMVDGTTENTNKFTGEIIDVRQGQGLTVSVLPSGSAEAGTVPAAGGEGTEGAPLEPKVTVKDITLEQLTTETQKMLVVEGNASGGVLASFEEAFGLNNLTDQQKETLTESINQAVEEQNASAQAVDTAANNEAKAVVAETPAAQITDPVFTQPAAVDTTAAVSAEQLPDTLPEENPAGETPAAQTETGGSSSSGDTPTPTAKYNVYAYVGSVKKTITVPSGTTITKSQLDDLADGRAVEWCTDTDLKDPYDFTKPVTADLELFTALSTFSFTVPQYDQSMFTVSVSNMGGTIFEESGSESGTVYTTDAASVTVTVGMNTDTSLIRVDAGTELYNKDQYRWSYSSFEGGENNSFSFVIENVPADCVLQFNLEMIIEKFDENNSSTIQNGISRMLSGIQTSALINSARLRCYSEDASAVSSLVSSATKISNVIPYHLVQFIYEWNKDNTGLVALPLAVNDGDKASDPGKLTITEGSEPSREITPSAWYADRDKKTRFNFNTPIKADTEVFSNFVQGRQYKVTFHYDFSETQTYSEYTFVNPGATVTLPTTDSTGEYKVKKWYSQPTMTDEYEFTASMPIEGDIDLYADTSHEVLFVYFPDDGEHVYSKTAIVGHGKTVEDPGSLEQLDENNKPIEGLTVSVSKWYTDSECKTEFDFDTQIKQDWTLYAEGYKNNNPYVTTTGSVLVTIPESFSLGSVELSGEENKFNWDADKNAYVAEIGSTLTLTTLWQVAVQSEDDVDCMFMLLPGIVKGTASLDYEDPKPTISGSLEYPLYLNYELEATITDFTDDFDVGLLLVIDKGIDEYSSEYQYSNVTNLMDSYLNAVGNSVSYMSCEIPSYYTKLDGYSMYYKNNKYSDIEVFVEAYAVDLVSFINEGELYYAEYVEEGETISEPKEPQGSDMFLGWFEEGATEAFDFKNTAITKDIILYAHWGVPS